MAYKVFTNGSVLQASEINDNLMRQSVMVFSNASARTAAITSPLEGMLTWLEDVNRYESYNGSAWVSPFGSTLVGSATFTAQTSVSINNIFSSQYDNYEIFMNVVGTAGAGITFRLRAGGSDLSTSSYFHNNIQALDATISGSASQSNTSWQAIAVRPTGIRNSFRGTIFNPAVSGRNKNYSFLGTDWTGGAIVFTSGGGFNNNTTVFDGLTFTVGSGTFTGEIYVFGIRK